MNDSSYKPVPRDVFRRSPVNVCSQAYRVPFGALIQKLDFCVQDPMSVLLGEDANQEPVSCNVEKMPNLLIAGNPAEIIDCIDSILLSILCKASPNDVRMLLVDTRVNYLTRYKDIPHLIAPVICDPSQVVEALKWAQSEWERRKKLFEDRNVKDIYGYNDYLKSNEESLPRVFVVIRDIVDVLTDYGSVVTNMINTLTSDWHMGIHLVVATSNPDCKLLTSEFVNLIAGRIAFRMPSGNESVKILGCRGAENLQNQGDMLYAPLSAPKPLDCQAPYITDVDVLTAVDWLKAHYETNYDQEAVETIVGSRKKGDTGDSLEDRQLLSEQLMRAMDFVVQDKTVSISIIQRRLDICYSRAAMIIEKLEQKGLISLFDDQVPRTVSISEDEWETLKSKISVNNAVSDNDVILKAVECNWSLHGPEDWNTVEWKVFYDHTYITKVSFVPKYDRERNESVDIPPIVNFGKLDVEAFSDLEALLKTEMWRDPNIEIRAYDGEAWKIDYYSSDGKIINSSGKLGYIYGEKLLGEIVEQLAILQNPYGAPACVKVKKKQ